MSNLSEQELLILCNYAYFSCSTSKGTIQENINTLKNNDGTYDVEKVVGQGATGDIISIDDALDILDRIQADEKLNALHVSRAINRGGIRAVLYADENDKEATLVFRGTGGTYKAWRDNVLGEYETDTRIQSLARDFVKYECNEYEHITVTGHSKGGNLSQYVTVVCGNQIDRCVSFDGQGFGNNFLNNYDDEIKVAKEKITSINGYNDFVNILLTPIAGNILYVNNQEGLSVDMHSCYTMLSNGFFDKNGNFNREFGLRPRQHMMSVAKRTGDAIVSVMDMLPGEGNEKATNVLGAVTAAVFSADMGEEYEKEKIALAIKEFKEYSCGMFGITRVSEDSVNYGCDYLYVNMEGLKAVCSEFDEITDRIAIIPETLDDIITRLDYNVLGRSLTEKALRKTMQKVREQYEQFKKMREALLKIIDCYDRADCVN